MRLTVLASSAEDERIARDLHDTVIQQLFALGMSLQATRGAVSGKPGERIDAAHRQSRRRDQRNPGTRSSVCLAEPKRRRDFRDEMLRLRRQVPRGTWIWFRVSAFDGAVDLVIPETVTTHLLQVFGEGLSNIARHANASSVDAIVAIADGGLRSHSSTTYWHH